jgi:lipopolysaccharide transport system ATP-binding protein
MVAIRVDGLGKAYRLGQGDQRYHYRTLRESLVETVTRPFRRAHRGGSPGAEEFWALKDVSFQVQPGEVVGIIGRNGAGKSTLLKILSRITRPTTGRAEIDGRVGSLLEVGTGFHPELTGRENVYLNGSILGMSRKEISRKFDEIVAFAEVEKFLDTPVKRYSSGMYVRLAFAVAAHLEPEILLIDEVLAVGDAQFQKKCLGKMEMAANSGRTVFFVSHQMSAVQRLCTTALLLNRGRLEAIGDTRSIIARYLAEEAEAAAVGKWVDLSGIRPRGGNGVARFVAARFQNPAHPDGVPAPDGPLEVTLRVEAQDRQTVNGLAVTIYDRYGTKLVNTDTLSAGQQFILTPGVNELTFHYPALHLNPGAYRVGLWMANYPVVLDFLTEAFPIEVHRVRELAAGFDVDGLVTCDFRVTHAAPPA